MRTSELGSLSKAAAAQLLSPQTASKVLGQLEAHLGVHLFHRTMHSMALTEKGQRFLDAVQPSLTGLLQALQGVRQTREDIAGLLRIVGPRSVLPSALRPVLDVYSRLYPEMQPEVPLDERVGNWAEDRVDAGFRPGTSPQDGLIARRLFPLQLIVCASAAYLREHGAPRSLYERDGHRCSAFRSSGDGLIFPWRVQMDESVQDQHVTPAFSTRGFQAAHRPGGQHHRPFAGATAASPWHCISLVPLLIDHVGDTYSLYLYYGSRVAQPAQLDSRPPFRRAGRPVLPWRAAGKCKLPV